MPKSFRFIQITPRKWSGRYGRIPGNKSVFHLRWADDELWPVIEWYRDELKGECLAVDSADTRELVKAVSNAKQILSGDRSGAFLINEFGQVIVPSSDGGGRRLLAGRIEGVLLFSDPFEDEGGIDISYVGNLKCGDPWPLPYVGCRYNLSSTSQIYFYHMYKGGGRKESPPIQDHLLIKSLRQVRRTGGARFIVNPYGLVLTKRPPKGRWTPAAEDNWEPVYIGRIRPEAWFKEEN
jgi:hypothetical protein